jgi:pyridine nucleotide-disulfide oxidoreductase
LGPQSKMSSGTAQVERPRRDRAADCQVAIVGAGPYGLSAAAHLKALGMDVRIFGQAMDFWASKMPSGMLLRSPRVASNISDPAGTFSLDAFESSAGVPPRAPLPLETFVDYGRWFQRELIPDLDRRGVANVRRDATGFRVALEDGEEFQCSRLVVAAGVGSFQRIPPVFASLPPSQVSHCYQGRNLHSFSGARVVIIGSGQSALESAALLQESGAAVELIARNPVLRWIGGHSWLRHLGPISSMLYSPHDVGPAGISRLVTAPRLVKRIPLSIRDKIRVRAVRPAGARWLPPRLKEVKITTGRFVTEANSAGPTVEIELNDGTYRFADHVLLGTGYSVDVSRYPFLPEELIKDLDRMDGYPSLGAGFSSSIPGLHFIGAAAARTFGPLLYFVAGTEFASRELASHLVHNRMARA